MAPVFYLVPVDKFHRATKAIVDNEDNASRKYVHPEYGRCLRMDLDQPSVKPPFLVTFGRSLDSDIQLGSNFSRMQQCAFSFHKQTGELLLHDTSSKHNTGLFYVIYHEDDREQQHPSPGLGKFPHQCVVHLDRDPDIPEASEYHIVLRLGKVEFYIVPSEEYLAAKLEEKLVFANESHPEVTQPDSEEQPTRSHFQWLLPTQGATTRPSASSVGTYRGPVTRYKPNQGVEPENANLVPFRKIKQLGQGGQGQVWKVVDSHTGDHLACKLYAIKRATSESDKEMRTRIADEVMLVRSLNHEHIVPYLHQQGFRPQSTCIEIFMPIYEGSVHDLSRNLDVKDISGRQRLVLRMLPQILDALSYVHSYEPSIVHRDIKPENLLYRQTEKGPHFLLADFGAAKFVDDRRTQIGTELYGAPEVWSKKEQTSKIDIFSLGTTVLDCLGDIQERFYKTIYPNSTSWYNGLRDFMANEVPAFSSMMADNPLKRPTAAQILEHFDWQLEVQTELSAQNPTGSAEVAARAAMTARREASLIFSVSDMDWTREFKSIRLGTPAPAISQFAQQQLQLFVQQGQQMDQGSPAQPTPQHLPQHEPVRDLPEMRSRASPSSGPVRQHAPHHVPPAAPSPMSPSSSSQYLMPRAREKMPEPPLRPLYQLPAAAPQAAATLPKPMPPGPSHLTPRAREKMPAPPLNLLTPAAPRYYSPTPPHRHSPTPMGSPPPPRPLDRSDDADDERLDPGVVQQARLRRSGRTAASNKRRRTSGGDHRTSRVSHPP